MARDRASDHHHGGQLHGHARETALEALASRQHGVVGRDQLFALGLGRRWIDRALATGRLVRLHRGVYAVGHTALRREAHWMGGVLAHWPGAILTHRTGAAAWSVLADGSSAIHVSVPRADARGSARIRVHRRPDLLPEEITERGGVPCAMLPLVLLDLAASEPPRLVERACDQAEVLRVYDQRAVDALLERRRGEKGTRVLRQVVAEHVIGSTVTRREFEERFLAFCRQRRWRAGRDFEVNARVRGATEEWEGDFVWWTERVVVETDGLAFHSTPARIERDRRRDTDLLAAGWRVLRITWRQLIREPDSVERALRRLLGHR